MWGLLGISTLEQKDLPVDYQTKPELRTGCVPPHHLLHGFQGLEGPETSFCPVRKCRVV